MIACAVWLGRDVETCTRGVACRCEGMSMTTDAGTPRTNPVYARRTVVELERSLTAAEADHSELDRTVRLLSEIQIQLRSEHDALRARVAELETFVRRVEDGDMRTLLSADAGKCTVCGALLAPSSSEVKP